MRGLEIARNAMDYLLTFMQGAGLIVPAAFADNMFFHGLKNSNDPVPEPKDAPWSVYAVLGCSVALGFIRMVVEYFDKNRESLNAAEKMELTRLQLEQDRLVEALTRIQGGNAILSRTAVLQENADSAGLMRALEQFQYLPELKESGVLEGRFLRGESVERPDAVVSFSQYLKDIVSALFVGAGAATAPVILGLMVDALLISLPATAYFPLFGLAAVYGVYKTGEHLYNSISTDRQNAALQNEIRDLKNHNAGLVHQRTQAASEGKRLVDEKRIPVPDNIPASTSSFFVSPSSSGLRRRRVHASDAFTERSGLLASV